MTEAYEDDWLVRVRAQVMCRDEGTGGWVALGGGGLANVMVGRRPRPPPVTQASAAHHSRPAGGESSTDDNGSRPSYAHAPNYEYFIYGKRISDQTVVLSCTIKKDFKYNKVMPTFHHWVTDEKRFGLTFQTAADARAFDKGVKTAVEEMLDGLGGAWPSLHAYKKLNPAEPAPKEVDEENKIFECLNLPIDSRSSSENSTASRSHHRRQNGDADITQTPILSAITLPRTKSPHSRDPSLAGKELMQKPKVSGSCSEEPERMMYLDESMDADNYPYVHLTAVHEYTYPQVGPGGVIGSEKSSPNTKPPLMKRDSGSMKKRGFAPTPPPLPDKKPAKPPDTFQARVKCRHCHGWYLESANRAGACEFAPDCFRSCIEAVSCIKCAQCMLYHCMSDAEGDFAMHPCACATPDEACAKRWLCISALSALVPCLWCYGPLRGIHRVARACRLAGGHHAPAQTHA